MARISVFYLSMPILSGFIISIFILSYFSPDVLENKIKFDELALGKETSVSIKGVDGAQIHCQDLRDAKYCIDGYNNKIFKVNKDVVLWLGNSQLHSINQIKPNDETATVILHKQMNDLKKYVISFSQPNANLQEHYILFNYLAGKLPISALVLPVVFDDMRETGIRNSITDAFVDPYVLSRLKYTNIGKKMLSSHNSEDINGNDMAALDETLQESVEIFLNSTLESYWRVWQERPSLRASFLYGFLYKSRNWLFNINPSTIRKMIPGRYLQNVEALNSILESSQELGIKVLVYIVPIRSDVQIPYDLTQYKNFKQEVRLMSDEYDNVVFRNLEALVTANYWGTKPSTSIGTEEELDFMHFQAGGHQMLSEAILFNLRPLWE